MGKCPERPSPSPPAVVGTCPYNPNGRLIYCWASGCPPSDQEFSSFGQSRNPAHDLIRRFHQLTGVAVVACSVISDRTSLYFPGV
jgi:hypothetical protein